MTCPLQILCTAALGMGRIDALLETFLESIIRITLLEDHRQQLFSPLLIRGDPAAIKMIPEILSSRRKNPLFGG